MASHYPIPHSILDLIIGNLLNDAATFTLTQHAKGEFYQPGDPFGRVVEWLWTVDQGWAVRTVCDLHDLIRNRHPALSVEEFLTGASMTVLVPELLDRVEVELTERRVLGR